MLIAEDNFLIALELTAILSDAGAEVVGPSRTVESALVLANDDTLSAAILDFRLDRETVAPVARLLADHSIPFLFYTGQSAADPVLNEWPGCTVISKPALPQSLVKAVKSLVEGGASQSAQVKGR